MDDIREELEHLIKTTDKNQIVKTIKSTPQLKQFLDDLYRPDIPITEQLFMFNNKMDGRPLCPICNNEKKLPSGFKHYMKTCSRKCGVLLAKQENSYKKGREKAKRTLMKKYGVDHLAKTSEFWHKRKETMMERYGVEHALQSKEFMDKKNDTMIERYDTTRPYDVEEFRNKRIETSLLKYGTEYPIQNEEVMNKVFATNMERYGVKVSMQNKDIKEKQANTMMEKYGVKTPLENPEILDRMHTSNKRKIGFAHYAQRHIDSENFDILNDKDALQQILEIHSLRSAAELLGVAYQTVSSYAVKHGIVDGNNGKSSDETEIKHFLTDECDVEVVVNDRTQIAPMELDFYIPDVNLAIEYCGLYWHGENKLKRYVDNARTYHYKKLTECNSKGIKLLTIFEDEWWNKKDIVKSVIKNKIGISEKGVGARNISIRYLDYHTTNEFLHMHHLQGSPKSGKIYIGGEYDNSLCGVMVFGEPTRQSKYQYELLRYSTNGKNYPGLASKLFKNFLENYNPENIVSFADRRWSEGELYHTLGFEHEDTIPVDYFYTKHGKRFHKSGKRKSMLVKECNDKTLDISKGMTELELAKLLGYDRIWDCGKHRFVWRPKSI